MPDDILEISHTDERYPVILRQINDPPETIYIRGNVEILRSTPMLAVVGSRKANVYGKQCMELLLPPVVRAGVVLVSGLAYGIDSLAHQTCVAQRRPTIAVLGSGVDDATIYPTANRKLARDILEHGGAVISEYAPGTPAMKHRFPERNRIIAGLCTATLIIQAAEKSGSLITARLALEYNRDVFAVPGAITDPLAGGTNMLIRDGATPILSPDHLLHVLGIELIKESPSDIPTDLPEQQQTILSTLSLQPIHVDMLVEQTNLPASDISAILSELELLELAEHVGGMRYVRK